MPEVRPRWALRCGELARRSWSQPMSRWTAPPMTTYHGAVGRAGRISERQCRFLRDDAYRWKDISAQIDPIASVTLPPPLSVMLSRGRSVQISDDNGEFGDPLVSSVVGWHNGNWHSNLGLIGSRPSPATDISWPSVARSPSSKPSSRRPGSTCRSRQCRSRGKARAKALLPQPRLLRPLRRPERRRTPEPRHHQRSSSSLRTVQPIASESRPPLTQPT